MLMVVKRSVTQILNMAVGCIWKATGSGATRDEVIKDYSCFLIGIAFCLLVNYYVISLNKPVQKNLT